MSHRDSHAYDVVVFGATGACRRRLVGTSCLTNEFRSLRDVLTSHTYRPPRRRIHGIQDIPGAPSQRVCGERGWHGGDRRPSPRCAPGPEGAYGRRDLPDRAHRSRHVGSGVTPSDGEAGEGLHQRRGAVSLPRSPGRLGVHPGRVLVSGHLRRAGVHRGDGVGV